MKNLSRYFWNRYRCWLDFTKWIFIRQIFKANLITRYSKPIASNRFYTLSRSKLYFNLKSFKISTISKNRKRNSKTIRDFNISPRWNFKEVSFIGEKKKKKIGGWKNNSWRWNGKNQRNRKKGAYPVKNHDSKSWFLFFSFFFFWRNAHTHTLELGWFRLDSKCPHPLGSSLDGPSHVLDHVHVHTRSRARITCYRRLSLILVSCSVLEFNRASFCKHTN